MKIYKLLPITVLPIITVIAFGVYYYGSQVNEVLKITYGANVLLIILILVDGSGGVLVPYLIYRAERSERKLERLREEEKVPVLEYDGLFRTRDQLEELRGEKIIRNIHFLRVKMIKGEGMAEHCVGFLTVDGTDISHSPCI